MWTIGLGGMSATLLYLATYLVATAGVFAALAYLGHRWPTIGRAAAGRGRRREEIALVEDLDGLSGTEPASPPSRSPCFFFSLAGIPPLARLLGQALAGHGRARGRLDETGHVRQPAGLVRRRWQ